MRQVSLAQLLGLGIILKIIITIRQAESALVGLGDHVRRVLEVLIRTEREQGSAAVERRRKLRGRGILREILLRLQTGDALQLRQQRLGAKLLNGCLVHARRVVVADLLGHGIARGAGFRRFFQNRSQLRAVFVLELAVRAPTRLVRRNRILLDPTAARVSVEIHARVNGSIHCGNIEHRCGRRVLGTGWQNVPKYRQQQSGDFPVHRFFGARSCSLRLSLRSKLIQRQ